MIDRVEISIKSGNGGDGAVSFRHEKFVPFGGPDGGDGGRGGDVVVFSDPNMASLRMYRHRSNYKAGNGENGHGQKKHGKNGEDVLIRVPVGTMVFDRDRTGDEAMIADCKEPGQRIVIAKGGQGGQGNVHFATSTNQAPRIAQKGEPGRELSLALELRIIADVGIIGFPNAGKSTLVSSASAAHPKIANYPFTTLEPVLGVVDSGSDRFVIAEIPGLIEGAHMGRGLGHDFLQHVMRTRILVHLIDGSSASPVEDMIKVNEELRLYDPALAAKPQLVTINKIDLPEVHSRIDEIRQSFADIGTKVRFISAAGGEGVTALMAEAVELLEQTKARTEPVKKAGMAVFRPQPSGSGLRIRKEDDFFVIESPGLERIVQRVDMSNPEVRRQVQLQANRLGVTKALDKAGIGPGDKVRCGDVEWEW